MCQHRPDADTTLLKLENNEYQRCANVGSMLFSVSVIKCKTHIRCSKMNVDFFCQEEVKLRHVNVCPTLFEKQKSAFKSHRQMLVLRLQRRCFCRSTDAGPSVNFSMIDCKMKNIVNVVFLMHLN